MTEVKDALDKAGQLGQSAENPMRFGDLAFSPRKEEIRLGIKTRIIHHIRDRIFGRISESSGAYRNQFRKLWQHKGQKAETRPVDKD